MRLNKTKFFSIKQKNGLRKKRSTNDNLFKLFETM